MVSFVPFSSRFFTSTVFHFDFRAISEVGKKLECQFDHGDWWIVCFYRFLVLSLFFFSINISPMHCDSLTTVSLDGCHSFAIDFYCPAINWFSNWSINDVQQIGTNYLYEFYIIIIFCFTILSFGCRRQYYTVLGSVIRMNICDERANKNCIQMELELSETNGLRTVRVCLYWTIKLQIRTKISIAYHVCHYPETRKRTQYYLITFFFQFFFFD